MLVLLRFCRELLTLHYRTKYKNWSDPEVVKNFSMLNAAEHEIIIAHMYICIKFKEI